MLRIPIVIVLVLLLVLGLLFPSITSNYEGKSPRRSCNNSDLSINTAPDISR